MQIIFTSVFGENVNYFNDLCCFRSQCTTVKDETQLSTRNNSFDHGSINEGQGNTNDEGVEEVVEYDGVSASLKEHESCGDCSLRQNLQNESNRSEGSEKKRHKVVARKKNFWQTFSMGMRNDCKFLKEWQKKQKKQNLIILFLHSSKVWCKLTVPSQYNCRNKRENLSNGCANGSKSST